MVSGIPQQGDIIKLDLDPRKGTVLLDQLVTLDYKARSFLFVEKAPLDFLLQLLNLTQRIFTV